MSLSVALSILLLSTAGAPGTPFDLPGGTWTRVGGMATTTVFIDEGGTIQVTIADGAHTTTITMKSEVTAAKGTSYHAKVTVDQVTKKLAVANAKADAVKEATFLDAAFAKGSTHKLTLDYAATGGKSVLQVCHHGTTPEGEPDVGCMSLTAIIDSPAASEDMPAIDGALINPAPPLYTPPPAKTK